MITFNIRDFGAVGDAVTKDTKSIQATIDACSPGIIRNIRFDHILAEGENAVYLEGSNESIIEDIAIRNMKLTMKQKSPYPGGVFDTNPTARGVFPHPIPAVFCRYGNNISLHDIEIEWNGPRNVYWKQALYGEHLEKLSLIQFLGAPAQTGGTAIELKHVNGLSVEQSKAQPGTRTFIALEDVEPQRMFVMGNDFAQAETAIQFTDGTNPEFFAAANRMPE